MPRVLITLEELEVDKVYDREQAARKGTEFDVLYSDTKQNVEDNKQVEKQSEEKDDASGDDTSDVSENADGEPEGKTDLPEGDGTEDKGEEGKEALESLLSIHDTSVSIFISTEDFFTKENAYEGARFVGNNIIDGAKYLGELGAKHGPTLLKHVYKGVLKALERTGKGLVSGSLLLITYAKRRINSFESLKEKIKKTREVLDLIETEALAEDMGLYTSTAVISKLKIGKSVDFSENVKVMLPVCKEFLTKVVDKGNNNLLGVRHIVEAVSASTSNAASNPDQYMVDDLRFNGFAKKEIPGYTTTSENVDSLCYNAVLPGDFLFAAFAPKLGLKSHSAIMDAYASSKMFLGVNQATVEGIESCEYLSKEKMVSYLDTLDKLCDIGLESNPKFAKLAKTRYELKNAFNLYIKFLLTARNKISIRESMSELISAKVSFFDKAYSSGVIGLQDYMVTTIVSSLTYIKASIEAQQKN